MPPSQPLQWQHKRGQAGSAWVCSASPRVPWSSVRQLCSASQPAHAPWEKARGVGRQVLWGGKGVWMLSRPENNVGA